MKVHGKLEIISPIKPIVLYDYETLLKVQYLVDKQDEECQWFHRVDRIIGNNGTVAYHIHDLFIPDQVVGKTDVESNPEAILKMWKEVKTERGIKTTKELSILSKNTSCWCHSHHTMPVHPSSTDKEQWIEQKKLGEHNPDQPQVMLIFNKKDEVYSRVWDPKYNLEFERVAMHSQNPASFASIDKIIETRFHAMPKTATVADVKTTNHAVISSKGNQYKGRVVTNNGHPVNCICVPCKTAHHASNCQCAQCRGKSNKKK